MKCKCREIRRVWIDPQHLKHEDVENVVGAKIPVRDDNGEWIEFVEAVKDAED